MCQAARNYFCGGFLGNFQDKHLSPPSSEEDSGEDADLEAEKGREKEKYMPKDHKKAIKGMFGSKFKLRKVRVPVVLGWGPHTDTIMAEVQIEGDTMMRRFQAIQVTRETITEQMLEDITDENRDEMLHTLNIAHCKLVHFPNIGGLHNLRVCKLSHNDMLVLKKSVFSEDMAIEWLVCDHNKLEAVEPRTISGDFLPNVKVLSLAHNKLAFLPLCFGAGLKKLKYLDLSNNKLIRVPEMLAESCLELQLCFLQSNELLKLPANLYRLKSLRKLFVSYNSLTQLPEGIGECSSLEKLHARQNRISILPESIMQLWRKNGGSLEEFLLDHNPLAQPGLSAVEKGQIDMGFRLLDEHFRERQEQRRAEEQALADKQSQEQVEPRLQLADTLVRAEDTMDQIRETLGESAHQLLVDDRYAEGEFVRSQQHTLTFMEEDPDVDDQAEMALESQDLENEVTPRRATLARDYYFQHLLDGRGKLRSDGLAELRSIESSLLLMKKVKYIEARKVLAKTKQDEAVALKKEIPRHLQRYLDPDLSASTFTGSIPVTTFDLEFCTLVYVTKPLTRNCQELYSLYRMPGGGELLRRQDWENFCSHVRVYISRDSQNHIWDFLSWGKDTVKMADFIAGWHIHDVEDHDPWIRRGAKVLKLSYYSMDTVELQERVKAKHSRELDDEDSNTNGSSESSSSSGKEEERRPRTIVEVPRFEGERRRRPQQNEVLEEGGGVASRGRKNRHDSQGIDLGIPQGRVSLTEEMHFALSRNNDDDSAVDSASSDEGFPSDQLSISESSSAKSFDAWTELGHLEEEEEEAKRAPEKPDRQRMEIKSDADIMKLMEMSPEEILWEPPKEQQKLEQHSEGTRLAPPRERELRARQTLRDARFRTDVSTVRMALREARRNMTFDNYATLLNFLLRSLKKMEHNSSIQTYFHIDDPSFRHATGVDTIHPYIKQLLEQMGFVCVMDRYWVWPTKHLSLGDYGSWGGREVKASCAGRHPRRLADMVQVLSQHQKSVKKLRHAG